jgi:phosphatidylinositol-3-phosphatase
MAKIGFFSRHNSPIRRAVALLTLSLLGFAGCGGDASSRRETSSPVRPAPPPAPVKYSMQGISGVFVVVLENHEFSQVIGNDQAPYLDELAAQGALLTNFYASTHPSLPNYLAILGGSTFGITHNCTGCSARDPNLALQLSKAGLSWRAYMEGMPKPCFQGGWAYPYAKKHEPLHVLPIDPRDQTVSVGGSRLEAANSAAGGAPAALWLADPEPVP